MVIVLTCRSIRPDKEWQFLESYKGQPTHREFVEESLTRLNSSSELPASLRSLSFGMTDGVIDMNVAKWESVKGYEGWFKPRATHDPEVETADRVRAVLNLIEPQAQSTSPSVIAFESDSGWHAQIARDRLSASRRAITEHGYSMTC